MSLEEGGVYVWEVEGKNQSLLLNQDSIPSILFYFPFYHCWFGVFLLEYALFPSLVIS